MSFSKQIKAGVEGIKKSQENTMRGAAIACFKGIIMQSPVDTGRFRANWFASGANESTDETTAIDKSGSNAISRMVNVVTGLREWTIFTMTNNLPYAERLEMGHSQIQAPVGMVRINLQRTAENLNSGGV